MRLLFDHNVPAPLRRALGGYDIALADECGWAELSNGDLLSAAEAAGFTVLITADLGIRYQQNLSGRRIALIVLSTNNWNQISGHLDPLRRLIEQVEQGAYVEFDLPRPPLVRRPPPPEYS